MKNTFYLTALTVTVLFVAIFSTNSLSQVTFSTKDFKMSFDESGNIISLQNGINNKKYLATNQPAPLLSIKVGSKLELPEKLFYDEQNGQLRLQYADKKYVVKCKIEQKQTHLTYEVVDAQPKDEIDAVVWGPIPTSITKTVGEIIGVVRDGEYAIGLQALNIKTLGGYPYNDEGSDFSRGHAAEQKEWGSVIQAYSLNRSKPRNANVWDGNFPNMPIPPMPGENVIGSKIALFGCPESIALQRIGEIEIAENLPHPMIDGIWAKISPEQGRSYLIADYSEQNIDTLLEYTKRADLMTLYHMNLFESWGHYEINKNNFLNGVDGVKKCVEKANKLGIRLGAHTLTNFIQTNDGYITPIPDKRLIATGGSVIDVNINDTIKIIPIASPEYFNNTKANWLHTVRIEDELIRYRSVSDEAPWKLLDCQRGAFGTKAAIHKKSSTIFKMLDHPYEVLFPNIELQREIARNLATRFNETGLSQMDFDGHEGCIAAGQGEYGLELFAKDFYDNLDHTVINGTSNSKHFYWHINSYCNWGEPWYEGFRESMQEYRINNQALFERNYVPNMLGWYLLTPTTSLSDIEWMLARAGGYNAGFALATSIEALQKNSETGLILDAIREWEHARRSGAFTKEQKDMMKNPKTEYHLSKISSNEWNLYPYHSSEKYLHQKNVRQPGEPTSSQWSYENINDDQLLQFKLHIDGKDGSITNPKFEIDNYITLQYEVELKAGQSLLCEGEQVARIYDEKGRQSGTVKSKTIIPKTSKGIHRIKFDCEFSGDLSPQVTVNFKTQGLPIKVQAKKPQ